VKNQNVLENQVLTTFVSKMMEYKTVLFPDGISCPIDVNQPLLSKLIFLERAIVALCDRTVTEKQKRQPQKEDVLECELNKKKRRTREGKNFPNLSEEKGAGDGEEVTQVEDRRS
jgi:hypothetical protein